MKIIEYNDSSKVIVGNKVIPTVEFVKKEIVDSKRMINLKDLIKFYDDKTQDKEYISGLLSSGRNEVKGVILNSCIRIDDIIVPYPSILLLPNENIDEVVEIENIKRAKKLGLLNL